MTSSVTLSHDARCTYERAYLRQVGKTLVFMRQGAEKVLEKARAKALSRLAILVSVLTVSDQFSIVLWGGPVRACVRYGGSGG